MKLITKEIERRSPALGSTSQMSAGDIKVVAKFFDPSGSWEWYMVEYDPEERIGFGLVHGFENELGYFSIEELESVAGPFGLGIERDRYFGFDTTLAEVMATFEGVA